MNYVESFRVVILATGGALMAVAESFSSLHVVLILILLLPVFGVGCWMFLKAYIEYIYREKPIENDWMFELAIRRKV
jgi:hypothetical protein